MARRGSIGHTAPSHPEYAEEAESAERAEAWPQAAALWRRTAECMPGHPCARPAADVAPYLANAAACDRRAEVDAALEKIARKVLKVPTLRYRRSDSIDFHELSVGQLRLALRAAYQPGRSAARK